VLEEQPEHRGVVARTESLDLLNGDVLVGVALFLPLFRTGSVGREPRVGRLRVLKGHDQLEQLDGVAAYLDGGVRGGHLEGFALGAHGVAR
jgi:hypothetical protein